MNTPERAEAKARLKQLIRGAAEELQKKGITNEQLARRAGINPATFWRLGSGRHTPREATLTSLVHAIEAMYRELGYDTTTRRELLVTAEQLDIALSTNESYRGTAHHSEYFYGDAAVVDDPTSTWEHDLAQGRDFNQQGQFERAIKSFQRAWELARRSIEQAECLVEEAWARWHLAEEEYERPAKLCHLARKTLGPSWPAPEIGNLLSPLPAEVNQASLQVYGWLALRYGQVYFRQSEHVRAQQCLRVAQQAAGKLSDISLLQLALHFQMRCLFERATKPDPAGHWRVVTNYALLEQARGLLQAEQAYIDPADALSMGHNERWLGRIYVRQRKLAEAAAARAKAEEFFEASPALAHIFWEEGQLAIEDQRDLKLARSWLNMALEESGAIKYAKGVAECLWSLGYLETGLRSSAHLRCGLNLSIASLIAYPRYLRTDQGNIMRTRCIRIIDVLAQDKRKSRRVFWQSYQEELQELIDLARPPFNHVDLLHTKTPESIQEVFRKIEYSLR